MLSATEEMEKKTTTEEVKTMKPLVVKVEEANSFEPWIAFAAGQAAAKEGNFEEAADIFSSVLEDL
jgi:hypothetical protein